MNEYIPNGMIQQQFRWEWVHYCLYQYLQKNNPIPKLQPVLDQLLNEQEKQLALLEKIAISRGITIPSATINVKYKQFNECMKELHYREYQLLQEYMSYTDYFLPASSQSLGIRDLINSQLSQVNTLVGLKQALSTPAKEENNTEKPDYLIEQGYRLERFVSGLTFPTVMTFDLQGNIYVAEAGFAYGTKPGKGRVVRIEPNGSFTEIAGGFGGPVTGIAWHDGYLYVAAGDIGEEHGAGCGQIIRLALDGTKETIVTGLKTCGDHFTGDVLFGPDGKIYFSVGTATNSAVVGTDDMLILKYHPQFHDTPARDIELVGTNFVSRNPLSEQQDVAVTGAYKPFGESSYEGEMISGRLLANGVIYCCNPDGTNLQIVADGFRNTFGLKFSPFSGKLIAIDHGADPRGSRQIRLDWDKVWEVVPYGWHGFPDFFSGLPATLPHFHADEQAKPTFLLKGHPHLSSQPLARLQSHSASMKFDFCTNTDFGRPGEIFVAQFGESGFEKTEELPGFKVVRVDLDTGQISDFFTNPKGDSATRGPVRPIDVKFNPAGNELYLVDFGIMGTLQTGRNPKPKTGSLWRIVKTK
ncbi:PQQ-dependent sugar dehydrogenase [Paenibacillus azoreducens]